MQEGAWPHTSRVTAHLNDNNVHILTWPSKSPYLNLIDHIWDALDNMIRNLPVQPRTRQELEIALHAWGNFPQYKIQHLISSIRKRCRVWIAARGGHSIYWNVNLTKKSILLADYITTFYHTNNIDFATLYSSLIEWPSNGDEIPHPMLTTACFCADQKFWFIW